MSMHINYSLFQNGKAKAVTMSYDDGVFQDIKLIEIFSKHGIKSAFHLNGGLFGDTIGRPRIPKDEMAQV